MEDLKYYLRISPENIKNDIFGVSYIEDEISVVPSFDPCCTSGTSVDIIITGVTYVYSSMTNILSGGTNGQSLLMDLSIPIYLSENYVDIGFYSVFDGAITQKDTLTNFIFTGDTSNPFSVFFFNTSQTEFKKYLEFSNYFLDWGDGSPLEVITDTVPTPYIHNYTSSGVYTITMSGMSPWGFNVVKKDFTVPFTNLNIENPSGTVFFIPAGGSWSQTPIQYEFIFSGDAVCENTIPCCQFTPIPFIVSGYTQSTLNDLAQYGPKGAPNRLNGKYKTDVIVTGSSGVVGIVYNPPSGSLYTAYTINDIDYYDYFDGTTIFIAQSSGCTDLYCSAITKNEVLMNVISDTEVQTNIFIQRGKNSALERIQRLGEINNIGNLVNYGYKFFNIVRT